MILDGDFTIMHSYKTQAEKEFAISIQLMAGGPIAVTDQYCTIGEGEVAYYTNEEMLALNKDRFVGKPMDATLMSPGSNIWHGRMANGDYIVGFFNREDEAEKLYIVGYGITWVPRGIEITKTAGGVFTWEGDLPKHTVSETGRVRALNRPSWDYPVHLLTDGVMIGEQEITVTPLTNQDKYPDKNWHAAQAGNYKLVFDLNNRTLTATLLKSFIETSGVYLIGSAAAGGWEVKDATPLQVDSADRYLYTWEGDLKVGELKLLADMDKGYDGLTIHPLASDGSHHRQEWYGTACCPSNISRFLPSRGNYIYGIDKDNIYVNLFIGNKTEIDVDSVPVHMSISGGYPFAGDVKITVKPEGSLPRNIKLRIPGGCDEYALKINSENRKFTKQNGYVAIPVDKMGADIELSMAMPVNIMAADPKVKENLCKRAVMRGPLVYCMEECDNPCYDAATINHDSEYCVEDGEGLLRNFKILKTNEGNITFIPYFAWDNRKPGKMKVWVDLGK